LRSVKDAQVVLDEFHSGKARIVGFNIQQNEVIVQSPCIISIHCSAKGRVLLESSIFVMTGKDTVKVYPASPRKGD
jgi:hypothetical protein